MMMMICVFFITTADAAADAFGMYVATVTITYVAIASYMSAVSITISCLIFQ